MNKLVTPIFRVSFPCVFEARSAFEGQAKKYSISMLFNMKQINANPEQKKLWEAMIQAVKSTAREKWADKIPGNLKNPFRDGKEKEEFQGYGDGVIFVIATTTTRPGLVDQQRNRIIEPEEFYAGCHARATVNPYAWSKMGKNGVSFGLQNIQKVKDDEMFGGRTKAEDDFDALEVEDQTPSDDSANATEIFS